MFDVPIVIECPECGEQYLISKSANMPSESSTIYSDGYFTDEFVWRTPGIIGCVTCELGFDPNKGKVVDEPDWDTFVSKWSQVKKAEPPTAGALALELRIQRKMEKDFEIALRKEFWYSGTHTETGRLLMSKNSKFKTFWLTSLNELENLLDESDLVLKAEINRQLGRFNDCLELLKDVKTPVAQQIIEKATNQMIEVFVIK